MSNRMEELGTTQRALSEKMNCTQQYVSKVLTGRKNMSIQNEAALEAGLIATLKQMDYEYVQISEGA